jgi:hypothetical protein
MKVSSLYLLDVHLAVILPPRDSRFRRDLRRLSGKHCLGFLLLCFAACRPTAASSFDPNDDAQCAVAFQLTADDAARSGDEPLAENMAFRAKWAQARAAANQRNLSEIGREAVLNYLKRNSNAGANATIACRGKQNQDPAFPATEKHLRS